jgi:hypothetical protein
MNKSILTLLFVLLVGFPKVASGEEWNPMTGYLFGNGKGSDELQLKCSVGGILDFWSIKPKEKTIFNFYRNELVSKYEITKYGEEIIEGSRLNDNNWTLVILINRYTGKLTSGVSCNHKDIKRKGSCETSKTLGRSMFDKDCKVVERKF